MARADEPIVEEIRTIIESQEDILNGWSDLRIVEEASRRTGATMAGGDWSALIAEIRSATDNDGQERHERRMSDGAP
jgi:predicted helicase